MHLLSEPTEGQGIPNGFSFVDTFLESLSRGAEQTIVNERKKKFGFRMLIINETASRFDDRSFVILLGDKDLPIKAILIVKPACGSFGFLTVPGPVT